MVVDELEEFGRQIASNLAKEDAARRRTGRWSLLRTLAITQNITVDGVVLNTPIGLSTDGVNPESSRDVVIKNSHFNNNDDNIAIKSGRDFDGRRIGVPSENIVIENNLFEVGHGAVTVGSEMSGSVRNVFAENNTIDSPQARVGLRVKTSADRGGVVEDVYFRDNEIRRIGLEVFRIDYFWERGDAGDYPPIVRNFYIDNVHSNGGNYALHLRGFERSPISNIHISNSTFDNVGTPTLLQNVQGLRMTNVTINGESHDTGHVCDGIELSGSARGQYAREAEVPDTHPLPLVRRRRSGALSSPWTTPASARVTAVAIAVATSSRAR
jgi:polygalacturonase